MQMGDTNGLLRVRTQGAEIQIHYVFILRYHTALFVMFSFVSENSKTNMKPCVVLWFSAYDDKL